MKKAQKFPEWSVPVAVVFIMAALLFSGLTANLELTIRDLYTQVVPPPPEKPEIVLVDADDPAIQNVGQWPWSRDFHARYLADMRSLGASSLSFDIEFVDPGVRGLPNRARESVLQSKTAELNDVFQAVSGKQISLAEASGYAKTILEEGVQLTARDNDELLGQALKVFGNAFTTLNYDPDLINYKGNQVAEDAEAFYKANSAVGPVTGDLSSLPEVEGLRGAIVPVASRAAGAAITNVQKDPDGTLRRMRLLFRLKGSDQVFGQLAFVPIWVSLGKPAIEVSKNRIVLKTSALAKNAKPDVSIPLDPSGMMIINWPHKKYSPSFHHLGISELQDLQRAWDDKSLGLKTQVIAMQRAGGYFDQDLEGLVVEAEAARDAALAAGDQAAFDEADRALAAWRQQIADVVNGPRAAELRNQIREQAEDPKLSASAKERILQQLKDVEEGFQILSNKLKAYQEIRTRLETKMKGAIGVYGWTSAATTDIGVTPFDTNYYNPGTHAAVANTILSSAYLHEWPRWASFLLGLVLTAVAAFLQMSTKTLRGVIFGFAIFLGLVVGIGAFYATTGTYTGALVPGLMVFVSVLGLTLVRFWSSEAEKRFIRGAFGTYLSPEVIKQLEADPDKLSLGGEKKTLTAVFTDVKGFSTFSESMDPNELVALLNGYLTEMSDIILDTKGTIDKFEGDAIIAFWGAPLPFDDHAPRAIAAALRMKKAEAAMNIRFQESKLAPSPLLTRIGINTGEMTVGNMGTARRMDYTMMGNAVNLAARLEGVNKVYGTWILTTQQTRDRVDDSVLFRKLDRVRVVGISTPVRLFEATAFRADADAKTLEKVFLFEKGIDAYEVRDWAAAKKNFDAALAIDPADGPSRAFLDRTAKNKTAGLDEKWDGVFNLTTK